MSSRTRRLLMLVGVAITVWYALVIVWAVQSPTDAIPVGIDYTLKQPRNVSQDVECNNLFASSARDSGPLPALKEQPKDAPPLVYNREACELVQHDARIVFALNTVAAAAGIGLVVWLLMRRRGTPQPPLPPGLMSGAALTAAPSAPTLS